MLRLGSAEIDLADYSAIGHMRTTPRRIDERFPHGGPKWSTAFPRGNRRVNLEEVISNLDIDSLIGSNHTVDPTEPYASEPYSTTS
ncbi:hypothetical protein DL765_001977 [Monosporascus sp. GIB2]|nr:hypothetical protein DL765_001977 [Monosporascus sp. GIB2]